MTERESTSVAVMVAGGVFGGTAGAVAGLAANLAYNVIYGPWFPQAGVDPQPAGWEGWWMIGGAAIGTVAGAMAVGLVLTAWRALRGRR
jgi:hypothetical protein